MTVYAAFLRSVNLGRFNKMKMSDLRAIFESLGLGQVRTYIQSGNVLFTSDQDGTHLSKLIEESINHNFDLSIKVILRTLEDVKRILLDCPFNAAQRDVSAGNSTIGGIYVLMFDEPLTLEEINKLRVFMAEGEELSATDLEIYLILKNGVHDSRLVSAIQRQKKASTMRNLRTLEKMLQMVSGMKDADSYS